jgi:hypothetical protein
MNSSSNSRSFITFDLRSLFLLSSVVTSLSALVFWLSNAEQRNFTGDGFAVTFSYGFVAFLIFRFRNFETFRNRTISVDRNSLNLLAMLNILLLTFVCLELGYLPIVSFSTGRKDAAEYLKDILLLPKGLLGAFLVSRILYSLEVALVFRRQGRYGEKFVHGLFWLVLAFSMGNRQVGMIGIFFFFLFGPIRKRAFLKITLLFAIIALFTRMVRAAGGSISTILISQAGYLGLSTVNDGWALNHRGFSLPPQLSAPLSQTGYFIERLGTVAGGVLSVTVLFSLAGAASALQRRNWPRSSAVLLGASCFCPVVGSKRCWT